MPCGSKNDSTASVKLTLCFRMFWISFSRSHSNSTGRSIPHWAATVPDERRRQRSDRGERHHDLTLHRTDRIRLLFSGPGSDEADRVSLVYRRPVSLAKDILVGVRPQRGGSPPVRRRCWVFPTVWYDFRLRSEGSPRSSSPARILPSSVVDCNSVGLRRRQSSSVELTSVELTLDQRRLSC